MEKLNVRFDDKTKKKIDDLAKRDGQSSSVIAREAMAIGLETIEYSSAYTQYGKAK